MYQHIFLQNFLVTSYYPRLKGPRLWLHICTNSSNEGQKPFNYKKLCCIGGPIANKMTITLSQFLRHKNFLFPLIWMSNVPPFWFAPVIVKRVAELISIFHDFGTLLYTLLSGGNENPCVIFIQTDIRWGEVNSNRNDRNYHTFQYKTHQVKYTNLKHLGNQICYIFLKCSYNILMSKLQVQRMKEYFP